MRYFSVWLGAGLLLAGCATTSRQVEVVEVSPQEAIERQAAAAQETGGIVAVGMGSSLTQPLAQDKAIRRGRQELAGLVQARVAQIQTQYLEEAGVADAEPVEAWFAEVSRYLQDLIIGGARPLTEKSQVDDGLATVWVLLVEDPGTIVQAMEIHGVAQRQLYELVKGSSAYRALLAEVERFGTYREASRTSLF